MKDIIENLNKQIKNLKDQEKSFDTVALDHGSHDQTRSMLFQSMFREQINKLEGVVSQLEILEEQLY